MRSFLFSSRIASAQIATTPTGIPSLRPRLPNDTLYNHLILPPVILAPSTRSFSLSLSLISFSIYNYQFTANQTQPYLLFSETFFFFFPILATCDHVSLEDFPYKKVFLHLVISIIGSNKGWLLIGPSSRVFSYWEYKRTTGSSGSASAWTLHGKLSLFRLAYICAQKQKKIICL